MKIKNDTRGVVYYRFGGKSYVTTDRNVIKSIRDWKRDCFRVLSKRIRRDDRIIARYEERCA